MEIAFNTQLPARILLTIATLGYGFVTIKADFNPTHATNPHWTAHARFHLVWQILSYSGIALIALGLVWLRGEAEVARLYLAAGLAFAIYGAFFATLLARRLFGGALFDENGYQPFAVRIFGWNGRWDVNVTAFSVLSLLLIAAVASIRPV
jgi:hypothetical protein